MIKIPVKIKSEREKGKEYLPCRIFKFHEYKNKLKTFLFENPNLLYFGVKEFPTHKYGIRVIGESNGVDIFYSLGDINFYFYKYQDLHDNSQ